MSPQEFDDVLFSLDDNSKIVSDCVREFLITDLLNKHVDKGVDKLESQQFILSKRVVLKKRDIQITRRILPRLNPYFGDKKKILAQRKILVRILKVMDKD